MRVKVARSSWREATRICSIGETSTGRAGIAATLRSRARLILPKLRNASPNCGHIQSPCEEIAPASGKMVPREFRGLHARTASLRARDFRSQIDSAYLTDGQWENARRFSRGFRFAPAKNGCVHSAVDRPLHLRFAATRARLRYRQESKRTHRWDGTRERITASSADGRHTRGRASPVSTTSGAFPDHDAGKSRGDARAGELRGAFQ